MDEAYRLTHLPLVRPGHPSAIASMEGRPYLQGRHDTFWSTVLPIDPPALEKAEAMLALEQELRAAPFAAKIAWDLLPRSRDRLHATVVGGMGVGNPPSIQKAALAPSRPLARCRSRCAVCSPAASTGGALADCGSSGHVVTWCSMPIRREI